MRSEFIARWVLALVCAVALPAVAADVLTLGGLANAQAELVILQARVDRAEASKPALTPVAGAPALGTSRLLNSETPNGSQSARESGALMPIAAPIAPPSVPVPNNMTTPAVPLPPEPLGQANP